MVSVLKSPGSAVVNDHPAQTPAVHQVELNLIYLCPPGSCDRSLQCEIIWLGFFSSSCLATRVLATGNMDILTCEAFISRV